MKGSSSNNLSLAFAACKIIYSKLEWKKIVIPFIYLFIYFPKRNNNINKVEKVIKKKKT